MTTVQPPPGLVAFPDHRLPIGSVRFGGRLSGTDGTGLDRDRSYPAHALVLVLGSGRYRDARGCDRRLAAGDVIAVFPELPHRYGCERGDRWDECFVVFDDAIAHPWRDRGLDPAHPVWTAGDARVWLRRFEAVIAPGLATAADACVRTGLMHGLVADLLAARPGGDGPAWLAAARDALAQPGQGPSLASVAHRAGLSPDGFRRAFRNAVGETPAGYRRRHRLAAATAMLARRDLTLAAIADATGFSDAFHLSKAWKQAHGTSPRGMERRS